MEYNLGVRKSSTLEGYGINSAYSAKSTISCEWIFLKSWNFSSQCSNPANLLLMVSCGANNPYSMFDHRCDHKTAISSVTKRSCVVNAAADCENLTLIFVELVYYKLKNYSRGIQSLGISTLCMNATNFLCTLMATHGKETIMCLLHFSSDLFNCLNKTSIFSKPPDFFNCQPWK